MTIVIVKLGGAAITNKNSTCELSPESTLSSLLDQVQQAHEILKKSGHQLILVHGAGSFGHPQARQYSLKSGWNTSGNTQPSPEYVKGYSHIRSCLQMLSYSIISKLESRNVPVLAMSPIDYIETANCEESPTERFRSMAEKVQKYLNLGFVPVLHGDAVLDSVRGCTILSGDIIMYQLTKLLPSIARCIFLTDVGGIYQADPKLIDMPESRNLIPIVLVNNTDDNATTCWKTQEKSSSSRADVTGGMQGKVRWAKKIVIDVCDRKDLDAVICRAGSNEALAMMTLKPSQNNHCALSEYEMTVFINSSNQ